MAKTSWIAPRNPEYRHLYVPPSGLCWWCGATADSAEHKYKRTDLKRVRGDQNMVYWGSEGTPLRDIASIKKDPHVRFQLSLCQPCNNARSQPFDRAYELFAEYVDAHMGDLWRMDGIPMETIYGSEWPTRSLELARYYIKHFGCRIVDNGLTVPESLGAFLSGAQDIPDAHVALIKLRSLKNMGSDFYKSLWLTDFTIEVPRDKSRVIGVILANFIGYVGVRFEWHEDGWPHDSFFDHAKPLLNPFNVAAELVRPPTPQRRALRSLDPRVRFQRYL